MKDEIEIFDKEIFFNFIQICVFSTLRARIGYQRSPADQIFGVLGCLAAPNAYG